MARIGQTSLMHYRIQIANQLFQFKKCVAFAKRPGSQIWGTEHLADVCLALFGFHCLEVRYTSAGKVTQEKRKQHSFWLHWIMFASRMFCQHVSPSLIQAFLSVRCASFISLCILYRFSSNDALYDAFWVLIYAFVSVFFSAFFLFEGFKLLVIKALVSSFLISTDPLTFSGEYQIGAGVSLTTPFFVSANVIVKLATTSDSFVELRAWTSKALSRPCWTHSRTLYDWQVGTYRQCIDIYSALWMDSLTLAWLWSHFVTFSMGMGKHRPSWRFQSTLLSKPSSWGCRLLVDGSRLRGGAR